MTTRFRCLLVAACLAALALGTPALAGHHETKGKGQEKAQKHKADAMNRADEARKDAEARAERAREQAEERGEEARESAEREQRGRGDEMRARREERKAIMDEAKTGAETGTPRKGKKPWWRFWESDEDYEAE